MFWSRKNRSSTEKPKQTKWAKNERKSERGGEGSKVVTEICGKKKIEFIPVPRSGASKRARMIANSRRQTASVRKKSHNYLRIIGVDLISFIYLPLCTLVYTDFWSDRLGEQYGWLPTTGEVEGRRESLVESTSSICSIFQTNQHKC